jgi:hypothetical protein
MTQEFYGKALPVLMGPRLKALLRLPIYLVVAAFSLLGIIPILIGAIVQLPFKQSLPDRWSWLLFTLAFAGTWAFWGWLPHNFRFYGEKDDWFSISFSLIASGWFATAGAAFIQAIPSRRVALRTA